VVCVAAVWLSRCCLDDRKWCAGRADGDAGVAGVGEELTPFGLGAFLAAHHGEHVDYISAVVDAPEAVLTVMGCIVAYESAIEHES
jgi:hypothetical protein